MSQRNTMSFSDSINQSSFLFAQSPSVRQSISRYAPRESNLGFNSTFDPTNMSTTFNAFDSSLNASTITMTNTFLATPRNRSHVSHDVTLTLPQDSTFVQEPTHHFVQSSPPDQSWSTLCHQFLDALEKHAEPAEVFDLAAESEDICSDHLRIMERLKKQRAGNSSSVPSDFLSMLRYERNSWRLARSLYADRITSANAPVPFCDESEVTSDRDVVDQLYACKPIIREMQLVVDWCEQNYYEDIQEVEANDKIEFYSEGPHYWEHTLHRALTKSKVPSSMPSDVCLEMDPDASYRTGKEINQQDKEDEVRMMRFIFRNVRAGKLDLGQETAHKLGYYWLAAGLHGWILHQDFTLKDPNSDAGCEGNPRRDLWKYACWSASKTPTMSLMERAIFGLLSANLTAVLPACSTWEDKIWAHFRCSIDTQIEDELRSTRAPKPVSSRPAGQLTNSTRFSVELPEEYWANMKTAAEILQDISCSLDDHNWNREEKFHFLIQVYIILNDVDGLLSTITDYINDKDTVSSLMSNKLRPQLLRFSAHLALFLKNANQIVTDTQVQYYSGIMEAYINYLIEKKFISLVAPYVAQMPREMQVYCYSQLLKDITDKSERLKCLQLARDHNLNIEDITKSVVETMKVTSEPDTTDSTATATVDFSIDGINSEPTTEADQRLIKSLEWLIVGNTQYIELLKQSNALIRRFILSHKILAARQVFNFTPPELISAVQTAWKKKTGSNELSPDLKNQTKQHLCWDFLFRSLEFLQDWSKLYQTKPSKPTKPVAGTKFCDRIAYEASEQQYLADVSSWRASLSQQALMVASKIHDVLTFPDSGWLRETEITNASRREPEISQAQELAAIRRRFIPQLAFLMHNILHVSSCFSDAIKVSEIIASDLHKLHEEFSNEQMRRFVKKMRESSIAAMNESFDSLGYEINSDDA